MRGEIDELAGALADGERIDWRAARARLTSADSRTVADGLESISRLSALTPARAQPSRRLPALLEAARLVSIACSVGGLVGFAYAFKRGDLVLVAILCTFAGTATYLDIGGRDRRTRALAACFWTTAGAFAGRGLGRLAGAWPDVLLLQVLLSLRPEAFFALADWQFARDFPSVTRFGRLDSYCIWGVRVATAIGVALFAAGALPLFTHSASLLAFAPRRGTMRPEQVFQVLVFGTALAALIVIAWRGRLAEGVERARVRLFLYAVAFSFGPVSALILGVILVPAIRDLVAIPAGLFWISWVVYPPMFLLPVATAYAVAARDVLSVKLVVQRGLRYLLARWLLLWGEAVPLGLLLGHLYRHADETLGAALKTSPAPVLLWFVGAGAIVFAFRATLIRALDQWALPGAEQPAAALAAMTEHMKQARTPLEVAVALARGVERAMQAPAEPYLVIGDAIVPARGGEPVLPTESAIPVLLQGAREPAVVAGTHHRSYYPLLLQTDRDWIDRQRIELVVPLLPGRAGSGLLGLVTLSSRRNALGYSDDDLRFVRAAAAAASLACDAVVSEGRAGQTVETVPEEVALQCQRCGRIVERTVGTPTCRCGGAWEAAALPKRIADRFELLEWLGAGGMGVVYRASETKLARDVALKTLPQLSDEAAERLMNEARTMASLPHEDVAVVYGVEHWRGTPLLVMEYLPGGTLAARLRNEQLADAEIVALVRRLTGSLARLHERGLYHGDVKPSNIGFAIGGAPKLLDFGLARALVGEDEAHDAPAADGRAPLGGTWAYLSPEAREGAAPGPMLDLWALAVVLCEALVGEHPFPHARTPDELADARAITLERLRTGRSAAHRSVLARLLALDPTLRPATAAGFDELLASL